MAEQVQVIEATLPSGEPLLVRAVRIGGAGDVTTPGVPAFAQISNTVQEIAGEINRALAAVKPKKATVEFGLQVAVKAGKLTALLVEGSGTASLKITLEWS